MTEPERPIEKYEHRIAASTAAGREALAVMDKVLRNMSGSQKVAKAFELTEMTRQLMRAGILAAHPDTDEAELQKLYVDRLLSYHGTSVAQLREQQKTNRVE